MTEPTTLENPTTPENEAPPRRRGRPRTHGLAARDLHIAEEDRFAFAEFSMYQMDCLDPRDDIELFYCRQIVAQRWFLLHADQAEAARMRRVVQTLRAMPLAGPDELLKYLPRTDPQRDDDALTQAAADNQTQLLLRYHTTHLRSMLRLEKALKDYRKDKADKPLRADPKNYDNSPDPAVEAMKAAGARYSSRPNPATKEPAAEEPAPNPRENYDNSPDADAPSEPVPQGTVARDARRATDNHPDHNPRNDEPLRAEPKNYDNSPDAGPAPSEPVPPVADSPWRGTHPRDTYRADATDRRNHPDHNPRNDEPLRAAPKNYDNSPAALAPEVLTDFEQTKKVAALLGLPVADAKTTKELVDITNAVVANPPSHNPSNRQPLRARDKNYDNSPDPSRTHSG